MFSKLDQIKLMENNTFSNKVSKNEQNKGNEKLPLDSFQEEDLPQTGYN